MSSMNGLSPLSVSFTVQVCAERASKYNYQDGMSGICDDGRICSVGGHDGSYNPLRSRFTQGAVQGNLSARFAFSAPTSIQARTG